MLPPCTDVCDAAPLRFARVAAAGTLCAHSGPLVVALAPSAQGAFVSATAVPHAWRMHKRPASNHSPMKITL